MGDPDAAKDRMLAEAGMSVRHPSLVGITDAPAGSYTPVEQEALIEHARGRYVAGVIELEEFETAVARVLGV